MSSDFLDVSSAAFSRWSRLTDEYGAAIEILQSNGDDQSARLHVALLGKAMHKMRGEFELARTLALKLS